MEITTAKRYRQFLFVFHQTKKIALAMPFQLKPDRLWEFLCKEVCLILFTRTLEEEANFAFGYPTPLGTLSLDEWDIL